MQAKRGEKESEVSELLACQKSLGRFETSQAAREEEKRLFSQQATCTVALCNNRRTL